MTKLKTIFDRSAVTADQSQLEGSEDAKAAARVAELLRNANAEVFEPRDKELSEAAQSTVDALMAKTCGERRKLLRPSRFLFNFWRITACAATLLLLGSLSLLLLRNTVSVPARPQVQCEPLFAPPASRAYAPPAMESKSRKTIRPELNDAVEMTEVPASCDSFGGSHPCTSLRKTLEQTGVQSLSTAEQQELSRLLSTLSAIQDPETRDCFQALAYYHYHCPAEALALMQPLAKAHPGNPLYQDLLKWCQKQ